MARTFCQIAAPLLPIRVENLLPNPGLPDCFLSKHGGLVEFKWARDWPKRGGPLRLPHYTEAQRSWARKHLADGGRCFLVLQVKKEWFIFTANQVAYYEVGNLTREQLKAEADRYFAKKPTTEELVEYFSGSN